MQQDAYSEILEVMRTAAAPSGLAGPVHIRLGKVLAVTPLKVDVAGTIQEAERFYISHRLLKDHEETMDLECTEVSGSFSLTASCSEGAHSGSAASMSSGTMRARCAATLAEPVLQPDDVVLLLTDDDQTFYLIDKVVRAA